MGRQIRQCEIRRHQTRRSKLKQLRRKYAAARTDGERQKVLVKLSKVAPTITREQFLTPLKPSTS
jgi:uncharacterized protein DUF6800